MLGTPEPAAWVSTRMMATTMASRDEILMVLGNFESERMCLCVCVCVCVRVCYVQGYVCVSVCVHEVVCAMQRYCSIERNVQQ